MVVINFVHELPSCPFLKLPKSLSVRLQCVRLKRDFYAVQSPLDGVSNRDSFSLLLERIGALETICGILQMPSLRPRSHHGSPEIFLDPLLMLLAAARPDQVELACPFCIGWIQLVVRRS